VLTGYVELKAFKALQAADIKVGQNLANMTVRQAIEMFINDNVEWAQQPNRQGHGR
jgi:predicted Fe-Mo cluster-binding NifX family protein